MMESPLINADKIEELRCNVRGKLLPLIDGDYVYLDLPYHENLGDTLIWEGTLNFLKEIPHRCIYSTGKDNYVAPKLAPGNVILLHGGGNFGDLWPEHHEFRKRVISEYPRNKVIILPQSVHYDDESKLDADAAFFGKYPDVVICVRDKESERMLKARFRNEILLIPDMAFFIDVKCGGVRNADVPTGSPRIMLARRLDKEAPRDVDFTVVPDTAEIRDWPTLETYPSEIFGCLEGELRRCRRWKRWFGIDRKARTIDRFWLEKVRPEYVRRAVEFIGGYDEVWSTRLHVTILAMLLGKQVHVLDNSYHKTRNFLSTWF